MVDIQRSGIGTLAFFLIPAALGGAALMWLAFASGFIDLDASRRFAKRTAAAVGAASKPQSPIQLRIERPTSFEVESALMEGDRLMVKLRNNSHRALNYWEWHWKEIAPDGTIIQSEYENSLNTLQPGDVIAVEAKVTRDDRAVAVVVWGMDHS